MYVVKQEEASSREEFGYKAAAIADMQKSALPVPKGFVISPKALELFISRNGLEDKIRSVAETPDRGLSGLQAIERNSEELFLSAFIPDEIKKEVLAAYEKLSLSDEVRRADTAALDLIKAGRDHERVAVRSSVIREPENSFAGVTNTFLNVSGEDELWRCIKLCWASLFYPYALLYSERRGISSLPRMSVLVQRMVETEKSGSILTNFGNDKVLVEGAWGLGNAVSSGIVTPDEYLLDKNASLLEKNISKKLWMYARDPMSGKTEKGHVPGSEMDAQVLTDVELKKLCELADKVQGSKPGQHVVDWCIGRNRAFILDAKPGNYEISRGEEQAGDVLVTGRCASQGAVAGKIAIFPSEIEGRFDATNIVVSESPSISVLLSFPDIAGYVTNDGGRLCNFSILARELKIPALTATQNATSILREGDGVKVLAEQGKVIAVPEEVPGIREGGISPDFPLPTEPIEKDVAIREKPLSGTRIFAKLSPGRIEKIAGVDGFILLNSAGESDLVPPPGTDIENMQALSDSPVWLQSKGENDFSVSVDMAKRLDDSGFAGIGVLIPVTRGVNDVERWRYQIPANARLGVEIKTPAMALAAGSFLKEGTSMVNLELKSLVQLSMGLARPDQRIHPAVLDLIAGVTDKCREIGAQVCISAESEHLTPENIEAMIRRGVDVVCVEPGMIDDLKDVLSRVEKKMLLGHGVVKKEPEPQDDTQPAPGSDDFSHAFSLL